MRRLIWIAAIMSTIPVWAQTPPPTMTQYVGTVRDLTGAVVTSGRITWTSNAPSGGVIAGTGSFVSTTVSCQINATGNPVASSDGTSPCQIVNNTALTPTGTSYKICLQPYNVSPGSCYNSFAIGGIIDISTIVPTPTTQPYYGTPGGAQGPTGLTGPTGPANALAIGTVNTLPAGGTAAATITGTPPSQTLNMDLVTGNTGATGPIGVTGPVGPVGPMGGSLSYPGVVSDGSNGMNVTGTVAAGTALSTPDVTIGTKLNMAVIAEGDSRMAGSYAPCSASTGSGSGAVNCPGVNMDIMSVVIRGSNFKNRVAYSFNGAVSGSACTTVVSNWTTNHLANYAPGGSSAPNATQTIDLILVSINDANNGVTLAQYKNCMGNHLMNDVTANGITPVLITGYYSPGDTPAANIVQGQMNDWIRTLAGTIMHGQTIRIFDAAALIGNANSGWFWEIPLNATNMTYPITSFNITNSGGVSTLTFTTTQSTTNTGLLATYPNVECGGFGTSQSLNYQRGLYSSGAGTQTIAITLDVPIPATSGTVTETGYCLAYQVPTTAGKHLGISGMKLLGEAINDSFNLSGLGSRRAEYRSADFDTPGSGFRTVYGGMTVDGTVGSSVGNCPVTAGTLCLTNVAQNSATNTQGFYAGSGILYIGGKDTYIRANPTALEIHSPTYTGPAGSLGGYTIGNGGSGYVIGDTGTVTSGGGSGATYTVTGVTQSGVCNYAYKTPGVVCAAAVGNGGSGYSSTSGATTAVTTGTGAGLTLNFNLSASVPMTLTVPSLTVTAPVTKFGGVIAGTEAVTIAAGAAAGTSPTIACTAGHGCSTLNGTITLTTGTSPAAGILLTLTRATARLQYSDCVGKISLTASPYTGMNDYLWTENQVVNTLNVGAALTAATSYTITYICMGW